MGYIPKACGFVLVREGEIGLQYLLLTSRKHGGVGVPKGHVDPGESELETALRETREETGLEDIRPDPRFRHEMCYPVMKKGRLWDKTVVLFLAHTGRDLVRLSDEHTSWSWASISDALPALKFANLREAVRHAALYLKDRGLFDLETATETQAARHLEVLPDATTDILRHLEGGARLARILAEALSEQDTRVHVEGTAIGARLHDVGRALGRHDEHQIAGLEHLRDTPLAPYAFACISHFTKGSFPAELGAVGLDPALLDAFGRAVDMSTLTWEEHCVALADACMRRDEPVRPALRFEDLRTRYGPSPLIDLQERRTEAIRRTLAATLGRDPLGVLGL